MKRFPLSIKIYGIAFIILAFIQIVAVPILIYDIRRIFNAVGPIPSIFPGSFYFFIVIFLYLIFAWLLNFTVNLISGIGLLRLKIWARYLVLIQALSYLISNIWAGWLLGFQYRSLLYHVVITSVAIFTIFYFNKSAIKEIFGTGFNNINLASKIICFVLVGFTSLHILSVPLYIGYMKAKYGKVVSEINQIPKKVTYTIQDKDYLENNFSKQSVFGYSIYLPNKLKLINVKHGLRLSDWNCLFGNMQNGKLETAVFLWGRDFTHDAFYLISKILKYKTLYEFQKAFVHPTWNPILLSLKTIATPGHLKSIEDANTPYWHGFVRKTYNNETKRWFIESSVYDLTSDRIVGIGIIYNDGQLTIDQVENMLASIKFDSPAKKDSEFSREGEDALAKEEYNQAVIYFLNALWLNPKNSDYAYKLAMSLYKGKTEASDKARLQTAIGFLDLNNDKEKSLASKIEGELKALKD